VAWVVLLVIGLVVATAAPPVWAQAAPAAHEEAGTPEVVAPSDPCEEVPPPERPAEVAEWPVDSEGNPLPPPERPAEVAVAEGCVRSYRMNGGAGELVINAVVCDISQPFTVTGSNITIDFTPKASDPLKGGSYSYFGDFGEFTVSGNGTYKLTLKKGGGTLVGQGRGKATTTRGTFSNTGKERYKMTPASC
jgi:hypothetical protein